jgi:hypothetical protein
MKSLNKLKTVSIDTVIGNISENNKLIREVIRCFKSCGRQDAADLLYFVWMGLVKAVDLACFSHFQVCGLWADWSERNSRSLFQDNKNQITELTRNFTKEVKKLAEENKILTEKNKKLQNECNFLRNELQDKVEELRQLSKFDSRNKDMVHLKRLLDGLDLLILDTEREQAKQIETLKSVANLIETAKDIGKKPVVISVGVQSDGILMEIEGNTGYEEFLRIFGNSFGESGSVSSINAYGALIRKNIDPKAERRGGIKRRTKN